MKQYINEFPGPRITLDQKSYLYFGGTAYLGLQTDQVFQDIYKKNIEKYGTSYGASRIANVQLSIFEAAEAYLAEWVGSDGCITMSSGYLAAQLAANGFDRDHYEMFYAPNCHSALFSSLTAGVNQKTYITYAALNIAVHQHLETKSKKVPVIFLDAIDLSGINYPHFDGLLSLPLNKVILVVDDSHGLGVVGEGGSGVYRLLDNLKPKGLLVCASLGKALGIQGGAIFSSKSFIDLLRDTDFFGGASPAAPAGLASLLQAKTLIQKKQSVLLNHINKFSGIIENIPGLSKIEAYPAYSYSDVRLTQHLVDNKILVTDFAYPSKLAKITSRIVISAAHSDQNLEELGAALKSYYDVN